MLKGNFFSAASHTVPVARQRLLFAGKELKDTQTLFFYSAPDGEGIILVLRPAGSVSSSTASSDIVDATQVPHIPTKATSTPIPTPSFPPEVDQFWHAAYIADWPEARKYLESYVSLDQLEQRCKKTLVEFFAERQ